MPDYDPPTPIRQLKQTLAYERVPTEEVWEAFKSDYIRKTPAARLEDLQTIDLHLNLHLDERPHERHEAAALLTMRRELRSLHDSMRNAGR